VCAVLADVRMGVQVRVGGGGDRQQAEGEDHARETPDEDALEAAG
jgi:hypothetical protein